MISDAPQSRRVLLTVQVEDYFQVGALQSRIQQDRWYRFESRVEQNTKKALALLDRFGIRGTFFVLGWIADAMPTVVREIAERGHEVASDGYWHRSIRQMDRKEFRADLQRAREAIERAVGQAVRGHRVPQLLGPTDVWALDVLAEEGYDYDSSLRLRFRDFSDEPWRRTVHRQATAGRGLWELPISAANVAGLSLPIAGGNYFRQLPHTLVQRAVSHWHRRHGAPFVMYFHVWELDPEQPRLNTGSLLTRIRQYRHLERMEGILSDYFRAYSFQGIADYLGLEAAAPAMRAERPAVDLASAPAAEPSLTRRRVSVVIPCFNEEKSLRYLANTLGSVAARLGREHEVSFLFVDDGSRDGTWAKLGQIFGARTDCKLIRHDRNRGVAAAILTGIRAADTEIVCSIDCDCTYDPHELASMIPLLAEGVDLVTASPYHPDGRVKNVPGWRLGLSKGASFLYRRVLRQKLATYTSCFRVYRRSAVVDLVLEEGGFLGVVELLARLDLAGSRIVEFPTVLEVRLLGHSKMKTARTIPGHLRLLARLVGLRVASPSRTPIAATAPTRPEKVRPL